MRPVLAIQLLPLLFSLLLFSAACADRSTPPSSAGVSTAAPSAAASAAPEGESSSTAVVPEAAADTFPTRKPASAYADLEIVTLLPRDAIPAIDNPHFLSAAKADGFYDPNELVIGVSFNGDSRAYSAPFLSSHEIVNDTVGGVKIAVTW
jgi:hypothetical protein